MKKTLVFAMLIAFVTAASPVSAQTIVKGHIVNERGETIEYVSLGFEADSVGTISDANGNFTIEIPANRKNDLVFTHVSFQNAVIPYEIYSNGQQLTVTMKDKVVELAEVVVGKKNKPHTLSGKSWIRMSTVGFVGDQNGDTEWGPIFKSRKDYVLSDILLTVATCKYDECVLSFNVYELQGKRFVNIMNKPIYKQISPADNGKQFSVRPDEDILLKGKKKYCICVSVVDHKGNGGVFFPSNFKSSYARNAVKGKMRKLPACPPIIVKGDEIKK